MNDDSSHEETRTCLLNNKSEQKEDKTPDEHACPWWINSPKHDNCLWLYIIDKSGPDGSMPELVQSEIAHLMGWSNTKTHFILKQAMTELIDALKKHRANQLLSSDPDHLINVNSYDIDPIPSYTSEEPEE